MAAESGSLALSDREVAAESGSFALSDREVAAEPGLLALSVAAESGSLALSDREVAAESRSLALSVAAESSSLALSDREVAAESGSLTLSDRSRHQLSGSFLSSLSLLDRGMAAESDPGIIIICKPRIVHIPLGQPGSPVAQGQDVITSLEHIERYVYGIILRTPLAETQHTLSDPLNPGRRFPTVFHRILGDTFFSLKLVLDEYFVGGGSRTAAWSRRVSAHWGDQNSLPPHSPLGTILKVSGGSGVGAVMYEVVYFTGGIFRS